MYLGKSCAMVLLAICPFQKHKKLSSVHNLLVPSRDKKKLFTHWIILFITRFGSIGHLLTPPETHTCIHFYKAVKYFSVSICNVENTLA